MLSGLQTRTFDSDDGTLDPELMEHYFHTDDDPHHPRTTAGGPREHPQLLRRRPLPPEQSARCAPSATGTAGPAPRRRPRVQRRRGVRRVVARPRAPFDSVSVCLSKGLGAPVGSLLLGRRADLARPSRPQAVRRRHAAGRHPRRGRAICPAAQYRRLADDHHRAPRWRAGRGRPGLGVDHQARDQHGLRRHSRHRPAAARSSSCSTPGVLALDEAPYSVRFVHPPRSRDADVEEAGEIVAGVIERVLA